MRPICTVLAQRHPTCAGSRVQRSVILGKTIRQERVRAGFSQECLAEKADLHPNYVGRVERGEESISLGALRRVAKALRVRVRELVKDI